MNTLTSAIHRYDDMLYDSRPVSLHEFLSDKYNAVHEELYNNALNKYITSLIDKHFTNKLLYEYYQILSKIRNIGICDESEIIFDDIYNDIFSDNENADSIWIYKISNDYDKLIYTVNNLNNGDAYNYIYTGKKFKYNNNLYYLWELNNLYTYNSNDTYKYLLTNTIDYNKLCLNESIVKSFINNPNKIDKSLLFKLI